MTVELINLSFQPECGVFTGTAAISSASRKPSGRECDPRREEDQCAGGAFYSILGIARIRVLGGPIGPIRLRRSTHPSL